ncbi:hypothetical protein Cni_G12674 [Canna indica]|uniref:Uncharacterized protein n=1 Tax=Canna indica TaxID=4628 RepID=A0AAQ3K8L9_9LILI|nr:hypothetical protein Cni_G12674 [Canna indica]
MDQGSLIDILPYFTFEKMQLTETSLSPCNRDLVGFSRKRVNVQGSIWLRTMFDSQSKAKMTDMHYLVIDVPSHYHMVLGQPSLNNLGAVVSTPHVALEFLVSEIEVGVVHADQKQAH